MSSLSGKKYMDMSEEYRNSTSKEDFRAARKAENKRMAGDALDPKVIDLSDPYRGPSNGSRGIQDIKEQLTIGANPYREEDPNIYRPMNTTKAVGENGGGMQESEVTTLAVGEEGGGGGKKGSIMDEIKPGSEIHGDTFNEPVYTTQAIPENDGGETISGGKTRSNLGDAPQVEDINNYDTTAFGKGSGAGGDRLSRRDLQALKAQGFSKQEIIDYSAEKVAGGTAQGDKARKLLDKWKNSLSQGEVPVEEPVSPVTPGDPVDPSDPATPPPSTQPTPDPVDPTPVPVPNPPQPPIVPEGPWDRDPYEPPTPPAGGTPPDGQNQNVNTSQQVIQSIWQSVNNTNNVDNSVTMNNNSSNVINGNNNQIDNSMTSVGGDTTINNVTDLNADNENSQEVNATQWAGAGIF